MSRSPFRRRPLSASLLALLGLAGVAAPAHATTLPININFQPATFSTPVGYQADTGAGYTDARGYGWVREDSLTKPTAQHTAVAMTRVRDRGIPAADPFKRTFVVAENAAPLVKGAWEIKVDPGTYKVTVLEGDAGAADSTYAAEIEGQTLITPVKKDPATDPDPFVEATGTVKVIDGRLTVSAVNGSVAKFNRIIIEDGADHTPPAPVKQVVATAGTSQIGVSWTANTESDLAGYRVYRSTSPGVVTGTTDNVGTPISGPNLVTGPFFNDTTAVNGTTYYYRVVAVDTSGNLSSGQLADPSSGTDGTNEATAKATAPVSNFSLSVDFLKSPASPASAATPVSGYLADNGGAFDAARGFGWVAEGTHTPLDSTGRSRYRSSPLDPDPRNRTLVQMFSTTAPTTKGAWEATVQNGCYRVTVGAGDPASTDSRYRIDVEGVLALNFDGTSVASKSAIVTVPVTDGTLTIDNAGAPDAFQGKLQYVDIVAVSCPQNDPRPQTPGNVIANGDQVGIHVTWAPNTVDQDLAGYQVYRGTDTDPSKAILLTTGGPITRTSFDDTDAATLTQYFYFVYAVDLATQRSDASNPTYAVRPPKQINLQFDMGDNTAGPSGWIRDYGQSYLGTRSPVGYGWVTQASLANPTSGHVGADMTSWGRTRKISNDPVADTFLHMAPIDGNGNALAAPAAWEVAVPNGAYDVTVGIGDAGPAVDTNGYINVEGQNAIADFQPTAKNHYATADITVNVSDGRLTIDQIGGKNTKLNYVKIKTADTGTRPSVSEVAPKDQAVNVSRSRAITAEVNLPNVGAGVDTATLTSDNVKLVRSDGVQVAANLNTSAGGDVIVLQPRAALAAQTSYTFKVTAGLKDVSGATFIPKSVTFTTGDSTSNVNNIARFLKYPQSAGQGELVASDAIGPDNRLYVTTLMGKILRFPIDPTTGTLGDPTTITTIIDHENGPRHIIGLAFDPASTADNPVLWVTTGAPQFANAPDWTGKLTRLSGPDLSVADDLLVGLPRSARDHETNSIAFGPDGKLYITQGSMSATGQEDTQWGLRPEHLLSGAVLRVDQSAITAPPLDVKTADGGTYNPFAPGAPVTVYASGIRNAYDLVWHRNGQLYVPTNGSAANGNTPAVPASSQLPSTCQNRIDSATAGPYTPTPLIGLSKLPVQPDLLFRAQQGGYYGHPNPSRCEYVFFGGNPTNGADPMETVQLPVGTQPDRNWRQPSFNFGNHFSPNGSIEYKSPPGVNSALDGDLLVARYSAGDDIVALPITAAKPDPTEQLDGIPGLGGLDNPLDIAEDTRNGNLYVTQLSDTGPPSIVLIKPDYTDGQARAQLTPGRTVQNAVVGTTAPSTTVTLRNTGNTTLTLSNLALSGPDASQFSLLRGPTLPFKVEPDQETTVDVTFSPTSVGVKAATLTATTTDPINPTVSVDVRGLGAASTAETDEPSLQRILDTYRYKVNVGDDDASTAVLPAGATLGDEVPIQAFRKANASANVTVDPIASFAKPNPGDGSQAGAFGWDEAGNADELNQLATLPNASVASLNPKVQGGLSFDPGSTTFGLWSKWAAYDDGNGPRTVFSQDSLNAFVNTAASHQARGYALKDADGNVVPNAYVVAFENTAVPGDFQDLVLVVRNVSPEGSGAGQITLVNRDGGPFANKLAMNRIGTLASPPALPLVHDTATVRLYNSGSTPVDVSAPTITGPFQIVSAPTATTTLLPGSATSTNATGATRVIDVKVRFVAESGRLSYGSLTFPTTSSLTPSVKVDLTGYWQTAEQGSYEPKLQEIANLFGFGTTILKPGQTLNQHGKVSQVGDEIIAPYWKRADTSKTVRVTQLAAFHGDGATPGSGTAGIYYAIRGGDETASAVSSPMITYHSGKDYQSLLPHKGNDPSTITTQAFTPPAEFSFILGRPGTTRGGVSYPGESTDSSANNAVGDQAGGCTGACGQHVRIFPAKTPTGQLIPNTYLFFQDYSSNATTNYDYNDNVYLINNITPDTDTDPVLYRVDAGATTSFTDRLGHLWSADTGLFSPSTAINEPADGHLGPIANTQDDAIYQTYRGNVGTATPRVLSYRFPTRTATKVNVRLHLVERTFTASGQRNFDVIAEGQTRLAGVDPFKLAGGQDTAYTAELDGIPVTDGALDLSFNSSRAGAGKDYPAIAGIEVFCAETCGSD